MKKNWKKTLAAAGMGMALAPYLLNDYFKGEVKDFY